MKRIFASTNSYFRKSSSSIVISLCIFLPSLSFAEDISLPKGWRAPQSTEIKGEWRNKNTDRFLVARGDFNGDGIADVARVLVNQEVNKAGLFAFVSQKNGQCNIYHLDISNDTKMLQNMGVEKVPPGTYKTACGKGYWNCKQDESPEISLRTDAINYFMPEGANSYFYWDKKSDTFRRVWISD